MRKVFPGILWCAFFSVSIALLLGACLKPVDVKPFLNNNQSGVDVDVGVESLKNIPPELQANTTPVAENQTVNMGRSETKTITVTNADKYDAIEWYVDNTRLLTTSDGVSAGKGDNLTVNTGTATFNKPGLYSFAVIGKKGEKRYSTLFHINVGS